jgi:hypothetical protein
MLKENQYTSPGTSRELKNAGIIKRASFYWRRLQNKYVLIPQEKTFMSFVTIAAFSIAELGEMIPWGYFQATMVHKMPGGIWQVRLSDGKMHSFSLEVEARGYFLLDLICSGALKADEINHPEKYNEDGTLKKI